MPADPGQLEPTFYAMHVSKKKARKNTHSNSCDPMVPRTGAGGRIWIDY